MVNVLLYAVIVLVWGTTWLAIKYQLGVVAPEISVLYRFAIAALVMFCWAWLRGDSLRFKLRDHGFLALMGAFIFSTNYVLFYIATAELTTGLVAVIFSTAVAWNIINARVFMGRAMEPLVGLGAAFGLSGITVVFWPSLANLAENAAVVWSLALCILGTLLFSLGNITSQRNQEQRLPFIASTAFAMGYGTLLLMLWALVSGQTFNFDSSAPYVLSLAYLTLFGTVLGFATYLLLVGRLGAARASYATVMFPIVALGLSTIFEDYRWSTSGLLGVALIIIGNVIVLAAPLLRRRFTSAPTRDIERSRP
jgi:drug/metabolite transporter (DMT)-like permease